MTKPQPRKKETGVSSQLKIFGDHNLMTQSMMTTPFVGTNPTRVGPVPQGSEDELVFAGSDLEVLHHALVEQEDDAARRLRGLGDDELTGSDSVVLADRALVVVGNGLAPVTRASLDDAATVGLGLVRGRDVHE